MSISWLPKGSKTQVLRFVSVEIQYVPFCINCIFLCWGVWLCGTTSLKQRENVES